MLQELKYKFIVDIVIIYPSSQAIASHLTIRAKIVEYSIIREWIIQNMEGCTSIEIGYLCDEQMALSVF